jgi:hypothetical protein
MSQDVGQKPHRHIKTYRPSLSGSWFLFFGLALGPAIIISERDKGGHTLFWLLMSLLFIGLILHRLSLRYDLGEESLVVRSWWGLGQPQTIPLSSISEVEVRQSFSTRTCGCGHLILSLPQGRPVTILAQPQPDKLRQELIEMARASKGQPRPEPGLGSS